jgi:hypothetical protein
MVHAAPPSLTESEHREMACAAAWIAARFKKDPKDGFYNANQVLEIITSDSPMTRRFSPPTLFGVRAAMSTAVVRKYLQDKHQMKWQRSHLDEDKWIHHEVTFS